MEIYIQQKLGLVLKYTCTVSRVESYIKICKASTTSIKAASLTGPCDVNTPVREAPRTLAFCPAVQVALSQPSIVRIGQLMRLLLIPLLLVKVEDLRQAFFELPEA